MVDYFREWIMGQGHDRKKEDKKKPDEPWKKKPRLEAREKSQRG